MMRGLKLTGVLLSTVCMCTWAAPACAQPKAYSIPPENLKSALDSYARQSGRPIIYKTDQVRAATTKGVNGSMSADDALAALLVGTTFKAQADSSGAIAIVPVGNGPAAADSATSLGDASSAAAGNESASGQAIVVTGTHIRSVGPSTSTLTVGEKYIERSGFTNIGDVLRSVPENFAGGSSPQLIAGSAPGNNQSTSGGSAPNLHGLGPTSTLTLIDGNRLATDTVYGAVDVSLIPIDAVDQIDIVTNGSSAIYGSDAVAGVVNVILKHQFDGFRVSGSLGTATDGGGFDRRFSATAGTSWSNGGSLIAYEFDKQDQISANQRNFTSDAEEPQTIYPSSTRNSLYAAAHEDLSNSISAHLEGLYTSRRLDFVVTRFGAPNFNNDRVKQYFVAGGIDVRPGAAWRVGVNASISGQNSKVFNNYPTFSFSQLQTFRGRNEAVEASADGPLIELPEGLIRAAIGGGYRKERYNGDTAIAGSTTPQIVSDRDVKYAFGELFVPLVGPPKTLTLPELSFTASGRYEDYSTFGGKFVPKLGLSFVPSRELTLDASWGKSYSAPALPATGGIQTVGLFTETDPLSPSGQSNVIVWIGGNPKLVTETANTWNIGARYRPRFLPDLSLRASYFHIAYKNRVGSIPDYLNALVNPADAAVITRDPSVALQQSIIASGGGLLNFTGGPYDPLQVAAVVDGRFVNLARQTASGVDISATYKTQISAGTLDFFFDGSFLRLSQALTPSSPVSTLTGTAFNPPKFRGRGGVSWETGPWSITTIANYVGPEINTLQPNNPHVSAWTTLDAQIAYAPRSRGWLEHLRASLSVENLFNKNPPYVLYDVNLPGLHFDPTNASPVGRFVRLELSKAW